MCIRDRISRYASIISMNISTGRPKSHIHTWIYPSIYPWISISTASLLFTCFCHNLASLSSTDVVVVTWLQCRAATGQCEKRQRRFDLPVDEWKRKVADVGLQTELDQKESRSNADEAFKFKVQLDDKEKTIHALRRENKNLSGRLIHQRLLLPAEVTAVLFSASRLF